MNVQDELEGAKTVLAEAKRIHDQHQSEISTNSQTVRKLTEEMQAATKELNEEKIELASAMSSLTARIDGIEAPWKAALKALEGENIAHEKCVRESHSQAAKMEAKISLLESLKDGAWTDVALRKLIAYGHMAQYGYPEHTDISRFDVEQIQTLKNGIVILRIAYGYPKKDGLDEERIGYIAFYGLKAIGLTAHRVAKHIADRTTNHSYLALEGIMVIERDKCGLAFTYGEQDEHFQRMFEVNQYEDDSEAGQVKVGWPATGRNSMVGFKVWRKVLKQLTKEDLDRTEGFNVLNNMGLIRLEQVR
jgi:hypothetical protein